MLLKAQRKLVPARIFYVPEKGRDPPRPAGAVDLLLALERAPASAASQAVTPQPCAARMFYVPVLLGRVAGPSGPGSCRDLGRLPDRLCRRV